jgi:hypothetical protein
MDFVQVNCPNCCAPLEVESHSSSAKCLYCNSTYIPRPKKDATTHSEISAQRIAAELALPRLLEEQDQVANQLAFIQNEWESRQSEAVRLRDAEMDRHNQNFEHTRDEKVKKYREGLPGLWLLFILFTVAAAMSGWSWLWGIAFFLLVVALSVNWALQKALLARPPIFQPLPVRVQPKRVKTLDEIRLEQRLASVTAEIASHRAFLDASRPSYR